ncbi:autotransporter outer membrane beta-barrel domain-containing protein [Vreelandella boliviensis]|uniref:Outer membrane protein B n=1 Tax=Vreelandella boliviensis LC1 TaxID=1072583 RepID=A0A265DWH5_9GAMM|nr:autotransporter outer membrane beta-barrel domain-containing protein [Halomonas boliviensis]EHJ93064.1 Outer membrane protein B [Halomonas boliviensis LC1]OZT73679.1 hypothetical protein CE457_11830 [Halomonas boliviensis LC1]
MSIKSIQGITRSILATVSLTAIAPTALAALGIETNFSVTPAMGDFQSIDLFGSRNGWRNVQSATDTGQTYTYRFIAIDFTTDATGIFSFGQNSYPIDTTMAVYYSSSFDLSNLVDPNVYNDDGTDASKKCGSPNCPLITAELVEGARNTLVISTYNPDTGNSLELPISAYAIGPGNVVFTLYELAPEEPVEETIPEVPEEELVNEPAPTPEPEAPPVYYVSVFDSASAFSNISAYNAANIIDSTPELLALFVGLQNDAQRSTAATQTLPLLNGSSSQVTQGTLASMNRTVDARQAELRGLSSGDEAKRAQSFWIKPFGSWAKQDDRNGVSGFDVTTSGVVVGYDTEATPQLLLGGAFGYANSSVDSNSSIAPQQMDIDSYQLLGYGRYEIAPTLDVSFQADVGVNDNQGKRHVTFINSTAESSYDSYTGHLGLGLNKRFTISPKDQAITSLVTDYTWFKDEAYQEEGAGILNLSVEDRTTESWVMGVRSEWIHQINSAFALNASLGAGYDLLDEQAAITSAYAAAPSANFTTAGLDLEPWNANAGTGLTYTTLNGVDISALYQAEHRSDFLNQTASLKVTWEF